MHKGKKWFAILVLVLLIFLFLFFEGVIWRFKNEPFISACYVTVIIVIASIIGYAVKDKGKEDGNTRDMKRILNALSKQKR